ncbi:DUF445 domain-containing protein [Hugenholtzia roseola]|uniref:DUF445 domain-containing protein n=1 Tax=Hugenholtzia roseola TaxID=1002 RepID=UPI001FE11421|nr:hypothetical protein [Hugenholtzia roseola]
MFVISLFLMSVVEIVSFFEALGENLAAAFANIDGAKVRLFLIYASIPLTSGLIGWLTNWMALLMTFYPLEYVGVRPLGWQGIIPSKARKMATKSVDLLTAKLLKIEEQFEKIDPLRVSEEMSPELKKVANKILDEVMEAQIPTIWRNTPQAVRKQIYDRVHEELPNSVAEVMSDIKTQIKDLLDLKRLVIEALMADKQLINEIFLRCGKEEFKFIERSGFWFGGLFGLVQTVAVYYFPSGSWWILPSFGLIVGYLTNVLALKLIFEPQLPINILGLYRLQGLFLKRQKEVAREYAGIITTEILTTESMFEFLVRGPASHKLGMLMQQHVDNLVDKVVQETAGGSRPVVSLVAGRRIDIAKNIVLYEFMRELPISVKYVFAYAEQALNLRGMLEEKMSALPPDEFEGFLRPAFQEDEWILILVGAILGFVAGLVQLLVMWYFDLT